jgi:hypothetical protein
MNKDLKLNMDPNQCSICYENYNKSNRAPVTCFGCEFTSCRTCLGTYLLQSSALESNCPNCNREWSREFLSNHFTQKFVNNDLKIHREDVLYQRERALLPLRQAEAERRKRIKDIEAQVRDINAQITALTHTRNAMESQIWAERNGQIVREKREFIQKCPNGECRGFLSTQWKCGMCELWSCSECQEVKGATRDAEHTCDPEKLATAKLIAQDTRPCPKCGVRLYKISGCNQMWCTACNDCAFNWETGKIEKVIHNPHYFEYQRRINNGHVPRLPGDNPCGGVPQLNHTRAAAINSICWTFVRANPGKDFNNAIFDQVKFVDEICRMHVHIRITLMNRYEYDPVHYNEDIGVGFLQGDITEQEFKMKLQRADKRMQQHREIRNILEMVLTTMVDIVDRYEAAFNRGTPESLSLKIRMNTTENVSELYDELCSHFSITQEIFPLFDYANSCLQNIARVYNSKSPLRLDFAS